MKILIDGRPLQTPSAYRGIGRYVGHIARTFGQDIRCPFLFFQGNDTPASVNANVFTKSPRRMITLSDSLFLPPLFRRHAVSAYHSTAYALPRRMRHVRYLLTIFDLTLLKFPDGFSWRHRQVFRRIIESARRADLILPISARTAADLGEYIAIEPSRLQVVRPMLDERMVPGQAEKPAAALPGEYLLYVGGADRSKNIETLLPAVSRLGIPLLVAGMIPAARIGELVSRMPAQDRRRISFLGHVPDRHLAYLYQHAAAFVFPSLNEGFGYPPLEALQCGTPAVVSRAGALPETLENAALYVDAPLDSGEWYAKIGSLLENPALRRELLAHAAALLPRYSPASFRKSLEQAYFPAC
jgi:glycosyltransferase involved in cell wall biosynthesis